MGHHCACSDHNNRENAEERMSKPTQSSYGWIVVGAGALMTCVGFGTMMSLAVFLQTISTAMGWSNSGISAASTIDFLCMGRAAFFLGAWCDRFCLARVGLAGW